MLIYDMSDATMAGMMAFYIIADAKRRNVVACGRASRLGGAYTPIASIFRLRHSILVHGARVR